MEDRDADDGPPIAIDRPDVAAVDALVDLWVALADDQRAHDSHILPEANREVVRDALARQAVTGGVRVARRGDVVVGFVTFGLESGVYEQDAARGVVRNVYVDPEYRGRGVGSDLMDAAEAALRDGGATVLSLESMAANERARKFYQDRGYAPHRVQFEKVAEGGTIDGSGASADSDAAVESDTHSKED